MEAGNSPPLFQAEHGTNHGIVVTCSIRSKIEDSETGPLNSPVSQEEDEEEDQGNESSDSECVVSDPCNYVGKGDESETETPDKKVSFLNSEHRDTFDPDGLKKKRWVETRKNKTFCLALFC